ncbi:TetR/AcrR family transcriptional regulator [Sporosarcina sp. Te-1]|uniref:TetR/AcrR family transcriptional regulator n=1 Tax=Sporosarcina sp. Te-1 TaxID=2818390 RepID=UPI001A9F4A5F|nr:TetR/AcrR family transcriptional regulator [Sporosarcina sp. Te-1]QTD40832.1 TetR/AcrR family transcriptional regulator [Sporosarcina sp. Te-1]
MNNRGRRKGADGEKSRELLLEIAAKQFALHGFHETKISAIVKEAHVTQPTFYLYFKSKEAIFQELVAVFKAKLYTLVEQSRLSSGIEPGKLQDRIAYGIAAIFHLFQDNEQVARIGFFASEEALDMKMKMVAQIEENLVTEVENGYFHGNVDINTVAIAIVGVIEQLTLTKLWTGLKTPEELAQEMTRLFLHGLLKES